MLLRARCEAARTWTRPATCAPSCLDDKPLLQPLLRHLGDTSRSPLQPTESLSDRLCPTCLAVLSALGNSDRMRGKVYLHHGEPQILPEIEGHLPAGVPSARNAQMLRIQSLPGVVPACCAACGCFLLLAPDAPGSTAVND